MRRDNNVMEQIAPQVYCLPFTVSNVYLVGRRGGPWAVVDSGVPGQFEAIKAAGETRFGKDARPDAIILTHAHLDHYGSALALAAYWDTPVYAHLLDLPYLTGRDALPPSDPTVGGFFAFVSRFLPPPKTDLGDYVRALPEDGSVPGMPGWTWHATPGHTPGHVSLFRESDRVLLAGDAVLTVNLDSAADTMTRKQQISLPPAPVTYDWIAVRRSMKALAQLRPYTLASGHGDPMAGPHIAGDLEAFAQDFVPPLHGRYIAEPARMDENGVQFVPPPAPDPLPALVAGVGIAALVGTGVYLALRRRKETNAS